MDDNKSVFSYILNKLKDNEDSIKYNIGIVATILSGKNSDLLEPINVNIELTNNDIINVGVTSIDGRMSLTIADKSLIPIFINDDILKVKIMTDDIDKLLSNTTHITLRNLNIGTIKNINDLLHKLDNNTVNDELKEV